MPEQVSPEAPTGVLSASRRNDGLVNSEAESDRDVKAGSGQSALTLCGTRRGSRFHRHHTGALFLPWAFWGPNVWEVSHGCMASIGPQGEVAWFMTGGPGTQALACTPQGVADNFGLLWQACPQRVPLWGHVHIAGRHGEGRCWDCCRRDGESITCKKCPNTISASGHTAGQSKAWTKSGSRFKDWPRNKINQQILLSSSENSNLFRWHSSLVLRF